MENSKQFKIAFPAAMIIFVILIAIVLFFSSCANKNYKYVNGYKMKMTDKGWTVDVRAQKPSYYDCSKPKKRTYLK